MNKLKEFGEIETVYMEGVAPKNKRAIFGDINSRM